jgi:hypothetical protein
MLIKLLMTMRKKMMTAIIVIALLFRPVRFFCSRSTKGLFMSPHAGRPEDTDRRRGGRPRLACERSVHTTCRRQALYWKTFSNE